MRMVFSEVVGTLSFLQPQADDDMADRLHYYYTTTFLLVTSVLISLKMYGGRPIECWMPAEYQKSWQEYTEIYCFSMNTYFAPFDETIPDDEEIRAKNMISYYQWTPFFLVVCAFMFYSPCLIWRVLYTKSGIRIKDIIAFANDRSNIQPKMREANLKGMSAHLSSVFRHRFRFGSKHPYHHKFLRILNLRFYEAYLTFLYIGIKLLFLSNVTVQMFLMNWFLQTSSYRYYGFGVLQDLFYGRPWSDSGNFPRVTYCDMDIRILGNVQKHTVQCVLVINIFIEKVFVLLWIWYTLLLLVTLFSLINWIFSSFPFEARKKFIARRLELADVEFNRKNFEQELKEFVSDYIKMDGVFMLRMMTIHAGILVCTEVVDSMWEDFIEAQGHSPKSQPTSPATIIPPLEGQDGLFRRKQSVLVPLVSAQPEGMQTNGFLFQSLLPQPQSPRLQQPPSSAVSGVVPYAAAGASSTAKIMPSATKSDILLKKPNPQRWRDDRNSRSGTLQLGRKNSADPATQMSGSSANSRACRRSNHGLPSLGTALGTVMASFRAQRTQSVSIPEAELWEVEEGDSPSSRAAIGEEEDEETSILRAVADEETEDNLLEGTGKVKPSSSTWHSGGNHK